jgi:hypothetical protein
MIHYINTVDKFETNVIINPIRIIKLQWFVKVLMNLSFFLSNQTDNIMLRGIFYVKKCFCDLIYNKKSCKDQDRWINESKLSVDFVRLHCNL